MDEYINRREFLEHMQGTSRYFTVKFDIENFPAADVAPVVHAQWIEDGSGIIICPECKRGYNLHAKYTHYCPSCGALMDGDNNGNHE